MARAHNITADAARAARWLQHHENPSAWFWDRLDQSGGEDACWVWKGRKVAKRGGYGRLIFKGKSTSAHRMALILATGEDKPSFVACHTCDNPPCCNPRHLWWGTTAENDADARRKGRKAGFPAKIDRARLVELRKAGLSYSELAAEFGVNQSNVGRALKQLGMAGPIRLNQNGLRALAQGEG